MAQKQTDDSEQNANPNQEDVALKLLAERIKNAIPVIDAQFKNRTQLLKFAATQFVLTQLCVPTTIKMKRLYDELLERIENPNISPGELTEHKRKVREETKQAQGIVQYFLDSYPGLMRSEQARTNQKKSQANKAKEKDFVKECWQAWQNEPERYKSQADFARDMLDKCKHLKSKDVIEQWCRDWKKDLSG